PAVTVTCPTALPPSSSPTCITRSWAVSSWPTSANRPTTRPSRRTWFEPDSSACPFEATSSSAARTNPCPPSLSARSSAEWPRSSWCCCEDGEGAGNREEGIARNDNGPRYRRAIVMTRGDLEQSQTIPYSPVSCLYAAASSSSRSLQSRQYRAWGRASRRSQGIGRLQLWQIPKASGSL